MQFIKTDISYEINPDLPQPKPLKPRKRKDQPTDPESSDSESEESNDELEKEAGADNVAGEDANPNKQSTRVDDTNQHERRMYYFILHEQ